MKDKTKKKKLAELSHEEKLKRFVISALRRSTLYWYARNEAIKDARIERGLYQCNSCKKSFGRKEIRVDHIIPVVKLSGFTNWHDYIIRMFPDKTGFQVLCLGCNTLKTKTENLIRKNYRWLKDKKE